MKKICLLAFLMLVGCVRAGDYNILGFRNEIFTVWNGYKINFYNNEPRLVETETINESNYTPNVAQTVTVGSSVLNNKTYQKTVYAQNYLKANKKGVLNSSSVPVGIYPDKKYEIIGEVSIDGNSYRLVNSELEDYVVLIDRNGGFYNRIGQIKGSFLVLLDTEFFPYPADLKMTEMQVTSSEQTAAVQGFDVKYDGIKLDRIWFTYYEYGDDNSGTFSNLSFPNKPGLITINNVGFRVLAAGENKITYMVLTE